MEGEHGEEGRQGEYLITHAANASLLTLTQVRLNTELVAVHSRSPTVKVTLRPRRQQEDLHNPTGADQDLPTSDEEYDEIVLCTLADTAKRVLGKSARGVEKWVLGNTTWSDDVTVTHNVGRLSSATLRADHARTSTTFGSGTRSTLTRTNTWMRSADETTRLVSSEAGRSSGRESAPSCHQGILSC